MTTNPAPCRLFFLDWLRIGAFALLVLYHVGMYYVTWDWHVKSAFASAALEPWMRLSSPWRLSLLFLVSGAAVSFMLRRDASAGFVRDRSLRLLLPLLFGMLVVVPPQSFFEVVQKHGYSGDYLDFMRLYVTGHGGFCRAGACLVLPTWNHLWFVAYLWLYCLVIWAVLRVRPGTLDAAGAWAERRLRGPALLLLPLAVLAALRLALAGRFPATHALIDDAFNHAQYLGLFLLGAALARAPAIWRRMKAQRWPALAAAFVAWAALAWLAARHGTPAKAPPEAAMAMRLAFATMQWCAIVALVGFAHRHLNRDHASRRYLTEAVFPVYILHQTLIVLLAVALRPLGWAPVLEGPVLAAGTLLLSLAGYEAARRLPLLRPWLGLRRAARVTRHGDAGDASRRAAAVSSGGAAPACDATPGSLR
ncbi:MAG TPA: acyltransferase family protein [Caldimonas sp.]|nr:acyltransferase family protein [Caldimonas sp.]HEX2539667.1 acyltransferase family protein [Caldimonas sp.]